MRRLARAFWHDPGLLAAATIALALGIGANVTIFSLVDAAMIEAVPYPHADELIEIRCSFSGGAALPLYAADLRELRTGLRSVQGIAYYSAGILVTVAAGAAAHTVTMARISPNLLPLLGVRPRLGRGFFGSEAAPAASVALVSYGFWRQALLGDARALGSPILVNGRKITVVGVLPPHFGFPDDRTELWLPSSRPRDIAPANDAPNFEAIARLKAGVTLAQAEREAAALAARIAVERPLSDAGLGFHLERLEAIAIGPQQTELWLLLGAVGLVLLLACANVSNLLLARNTRRERELATRLALGAGRGGLMRLLLGESLFLAGCGGTAGSLLALGGIAVVRRLAPPSIPRTGAMALDAPVLVFAALISLLSALLLTIWPALRVSGMDEGIGVFLREGNLASRAALGSRRRLLPNLLAGGQVAAALALAVGAALAARSLAALVAVPLGFRTDHVLVAQLAEEFPLHLGRRAGPVFYRNVLRAAATLPGVRSAALAATGPLGGAALHTPVGLHPGSALAENPFTVLQSVTPEYFATLGIPVLRGRAFTAQDAESDRWVVIVNRGLAQRLWPGRDPVGRTLYFAMARMCPVVGEVGDARDIRLDRPPQPTVYIPFPVYVNLAGTLLLRAEGSPARLAGPLARRIWRLYPQEQIADIRPLSYVVSHSAIGPRFRLAALGGFALLALVLAVVGTAAVLGAAAASRTREFGIRLALGARPTALVWLTLRDGLVVLVAGVSCGLLGAWFATRWLASMLYGVTARDFVSFAGAAGILLGAGTVACLVPAWRAGRIQPAQALRDE